MPSDLLEKLRLERTEREKQRKLELEKYEQELLARRDQRKQDRLQAREKEKNSDLLIKNLTKKAIEDTFKRIEISNLESDLKRKEFESSQMSSRTKREGDKEIFDRRKKLLRDLELSRRKRKIPPRPKRYTIHPLEFYGIDFSVKANVSDKQMELYELSRKREEDYLKDPKYIDSFLKTGSVFLKALMETTNMDHESVQGLLKKKRFTGSLTTVNENEAEEGISNLNFKEPEPNDEDFLNSLKDLSHQSKASTKVTTSESNKTKIRWSEQIKRGKVDFSDYFPKNIGVIEGITVFRIEDMKPVPVSTQNIGTFSVGDAYIVLRTSTDKFGSSEHKVYQWVGEDSSLDKRACSAFYAVGLKELTGAQINVIREESGSESTEFKNLFLGYNFDFVNVDSSYAADSGLYTVQDRIYMIQMYLIRCRRVIRKTSKGGAKEESKIGDLVLTLTEVSPSSLNTQHVFVIDCGLIVYIWYGKSAPLGNRIQARFFANRIIHNERVSKAEMFEIFEGTEPDEFWDVFQGERFTGNDSEEYLNDIQYPKLYLFDESLLRVNLKRIDINQFSIWPPSSPHNNKIPLLPNKELLDSAKCAVLDCKTELYFWTGKKSSFALRQICENIILEKVCQLEDRVDYMINSKQMEDVETESFKVRFSSWNVKQSSFDFSENKPTYSRSPQAKLIALKKKEGENIKVDIKLIYSPPFNGKYTSEEDQFVSTLFAKANMLIQNLQCFIFDRFTNRFIRLPEWTNDGSREKGHFWDKETYVFLCIYKKEEEISDDDIIEDSAEDNSKMMSYECATYVWQGRNVTSPSFAYLTFQFQFKSVLQELIAQLSENQIEMKTVFLNQEKESVAFMAHLNKQCVIHSGYRPAEFPSLIPRPLKELSRDPRDIIVPTNVRLYHIKTDLKYKVTRMIQVPAVVTSLCTRNIFLLTYTGKNDLDPNIESNTFLWTGRGASKEEEKMAAEMVEKYAALRMEALVKEQQSRLSILAPKLFSIVKEKTEGRIFWSLLAPTFERPTASNPVPFGQGYYYSIPPPRMFRCCTENGNFEVQDLSYSFVVSDLRSDCVCLLDSGPGLGKPHLVWAWIGKDASDVVIKLSKKTLDSYLDHMNDGRSLDYSEWDKSERSNDKKKVRKTITGATRYDVAITREGEESFEFKAFFHGWGDVYKIEPFARSKLFKSEEEYEDLLIFMKNNFTKRKEEPTSVFMKQERKALEEYRKQKKLKEI